MQFSEKRAAKTLPIKMQMILIMLMGCYIPCNSISPFKWRGGGGGGQNNGVMINTANSPAEPTPTAGSSHGHGHGGPVTFIPIDQSPELQRPLKYNLNNHHTRIHDSGETQRRQYRNPFDIVYEWRQLDYEYPTCMFLTSVFTRITL